MLQGEVIQSDKYGNNDMSKQGNQKKKSTIGSKLGQLLWTVMRHLLNREKVRKESFQNMKQMFQIFSYNRKMVGTRENHRTCELHIFIASMTMVIFPRSVLRVCVFNCVLPRWHSGKESTCQCRTCQRLGLNPWVKKILWRRKWPPTPVFLPGEFH